MKKAKEYKELKKLEKDLEIQRRLKRK